MKTLLITGVAGFIGSHILRHILQNTDWRVTGIASWKHKGLPERVKLAVAGVEGWEERVRVVTHDLAAPFPDHTATGIGHHDYVVNAAAESHVNRSIDSPRHFAENNVGVALTVLEHARLFPPEKFVQVSTDEVYGAASPGHCHREWEEILPSNPYSASKACQEAIAIAYWRTYGVPLVITNTMNNFGETQDSEKYVAQLVRACANGDRVTVHGARDEAGLWTYGSRFYMHARNHADAVLWLLQNHVPERWRDSDEVMRPSRFNVVGDVELDNYELAVRVADAVGREPEIHAVDYHATRPGHDRRYALDGSKLRRAGWRPPLEFQASLERYVRWTLEHPEWL